MKRMFLLFVVSVFCCLLFPAAAQEAVYTVTETELTQLESILQTLQTNKQKQHSQVRLLQEQLNTAHSKAKNLQATLTKAEAQVKDLTSQLQTERIALADLQKSYNEYEQEVVKQIAEQQVIINKQKDTLHRRMITIIILSSIISMTVIAVGVKWFIKGKLSFLHHP